MEAVESCGVEVKEEVIGGELWVCFGKDRESLDVGAVVPQEVA